MSGDALDRLRDLAYDLYRTHPDPYDAHYQLELIDRELPKIRAVLDAADAWERADMKSWETYAPTVDALIAAVRARREQP